MTTLRAIRKRITSVRNTQKITKTMKMVAASQLRRMQHTTLRSRAFKEHLKGIVYNLARRGGENIHPLMKPRMEVKKIDLLVVSSDRGLCGSLNENLLKRVVGAVEDYSLQGRTVSLTVMGKKGISFLKSAGIDVRKEIAGWSESYNKEMASLQAEEFSSRYLAGDADEVIAVYNRSKTAASQEVVFELVIPMSLIENGPEYTIDYIYEPSREVVLEKIVRECLSAVIYQIFCEARMSELSARLLAMDKATKNADDIIKLLTGRYNRLRQANITKELSDIIIGAEAVR